jgi:nitrite reductase/ring-hydroxylating ferredoxin subunit
VPRDVRVASAAEIPPGTWKQVKLTKWDLAIFNLEGRFLAARDECPHQLVSLAGGSLSGSVITCPGHCWKFDLGRDGQCVDDPDLKLRMFPVKVVEGNVYVET